MADQSLISTVHMYTNSAYVPISKTSHAEVMLVPGGQTQDLRLAACEVPLGYPGDSYRQAPWLPLAESDEAECTGSVLSEDILSVDFLNKPAVGMFKSSIISVDTISWYMFPWRLPIRDPNLGQILGFWLF